MEYKEHSTLLGQVSTLNNHYKKINELTGENFNIFRILKLESSEVRLHSAFLASLLNPHGSHGQKDAFLNLFVKAFCYKNNTIDTKSCIVEIEKHTGFISPDGTEGGRIDILIMDRFGNQIIVENKIYAGDQLNQLVRYNKSSPNADLVYLTLDGKAPHTKSFGNLKIDEHFKCYSYRSDILTWLENCRKEVAIFPIVRESITQYINLIKYLTNQTVNQNMENELHHLLKLNLEPAFTIADNLDQTLIKVYEDYFIALKATCNKIGLQCYSSVDFDKNYTGIWISKDTWRYVNIGFQFHSYDKELRYGIIKKNNKEPLPQDLLKSISGISNNSSKVDVWWPWYRKLEEPFNNWSKFQAWKAITDGGMEKVMVEKIKELLSQTKQMKL